MFIFIDFSLPSADPDLSAQPVTFTEMDIDGVETSKDQPEHFASGCGIDSNILDSKEADDSSCLHDDQIQTQDLNEGLLHSELSEGPSGVPGIMDFPFNAAKVPSSDVNECAQAPSTPGLITEAVPSLNLLRKTSIHNAVEDVIGEPSSESVDTDSTKLMPEENLGNLVNEPCHHIDGMKPGLDCTSLSEEKCETDIHPLKNMENESSCGARQDVHVKLPEDGPSPSVGLISSDLIQSVSSPTSVLSEPKSVSPAPDCSGIHLVEPDELSLKCIKDRVETLETGTLCRVLLSIPSIDQTHNDAEAVEHQADSLDVTTLSLRCFLEASSLQASYNNKPPGCVERVPVNYNSIINGHVSSEVALAVESVKNGQPSISFSLEVPTKAGPVGAVEDSTPSSFASPSKQEVKIHVTMSISGHAAHQ